MQTQTNQESSQQLVNVIASGYEWICPHCEQYNKIAGLREDVTCSQCGRTFGVGVVEDAID